MNLSNNKYMENKTIRYFAYEIRKDILSTYFWQRCTKTHTPLTLLVGIQIWRTFQRIIWQSISKFFKICIAYFYTQGE